MFWVPSQPVIVLCRRLSYNKGPFVSIYTLTFNILSVFNLQKFIMELIGNHDEKIKYWRHKLNQKNKSKTLKTNNTNKTKDRSPQKKLSESITSPRARQSILNCTLNKLKQQLQTSTVKKVKKQSKGKMQGQYKKIKDRQKSTQKIIMKKVGQIPKTQRYNRQPLLKYIAINTSKSRSKSAKYKCQQFKPHKKDIKNTCNDIKKKKNKVGKKDKKNLIDKFKILNLSNSQKIWKSIELDDQIKTVPLKNYQTLNSFKNSVIIYDDISPNKQQFYLKRRQEQQLGYYLAIAERYLKGCLFRLSFNKLLNDKHMFEQNKNMKKQTALENMIHQQQQKWLRLKQNLERLKQKQQLSQYLQQIIRQVDQNHRQLQNVDLEGKNTVKSKLKMDEMVYNQVNPLLIKIVESKMIVDERSKFTCPKKSLIQPQTDEGKLISFQNAQNSRPDSEQYKDCKQFARSQPIDNKQQKQTIQDAIIQNLYQSFELSQQKSGLHTSLLKSQTHSFIHIQVDQSEDNSDLLMHIDKQRQQRQSTNNIIVLIIQNELIQQMVVELNPHQKQLIFCSYNNNIVQVYNNQLLDKPFLQHATIQSKDEYITNLILKFMAFANASQTIKLRQRMSIPLGVSSSVFLRCMRVLERSNRQQDQCQAHEDANIHHQHINFICQEYFHLDEAQTQNYVQIISNDEFSDFQRFNSINGEVDQNQFYFNRCIYDQMNTIFDNLRPYGKKGLPPVYFPKEFKEPSLHLINKTLLRQFAQLSTFNLGIITCKHQGFIPQMQTSVNESLRLFKIDVVKQIQQEYQQKVEDIFEVTYNIMDIIEENIIMQQIQLLSRYIKKPCELSFDD